MIQAKLLVCFLLSITHKFQMENHLLSCDIIKVAPSERHHRYQFSLPQDFFLILNRYSCGELRFT